VDNVTNRHTPVDGAGSVEPACGRRVVKPGNQGPVKLTV